MTACLLLMGGLALLLNPCRADEAKPPADRKTNRVLSPWVVYSGAETIEALRPNARFIKSISVCGDPSAEFIGQCHDLGLKTHLLVGGHDGAVFATPAARRQLIASYLERLRATGADGIDVNFESLEREFRQPYSLLLRELARALHAAGKELSMCVSYVMCTWRSNEVATPDPEADIDGGWYDPAVVGQACDLVRVMCYDMISPSSTAVGPVSSTPWARDAMRYWGRYVPRGKLVMGLPAYSRDFPMNGKRESLSLYAPAPDLPADHPVQRLWMPYESLYQYRYTAPDGVEHVFFASDADSTRAHLRTATALRLNTIGFWHYAAVPEATWEVVRGWLTKQ